MKKALILFFGFFKINWMQEAEFRVNLIINSLMELWWSVLFLFFSQILFGHINSIAGWHKNEVMLLIVTRSLAMGLLRAFLMPGVEHLSERIKSGSLDMLLTKPVSARLLLSISEQNMDTYIRTMVSLILVVVLTIKMGFDLSIIKLLSFGIVIILGVFSLYNVFFIMNTTAFWLTSLFNIGHLNNSLTDVAQFPPEAFEARVRAVLLYLVPTIFIAAVPVKILMNGPILSSLFLVILTATVSYVISQMFWNFALKHYSSASS